MTILYRAAELLAKPQPQEGTIPLLLEAARAFVRAGGAPTLREWLELTAEERVALVIARKEVAIEDDVRAARAINEPGSVRADVDEETGNLKNLVERAAGTAVERLKGMEIQ